VTTSTDYTVPQDPTEATTNVEATHVPPLPVEVVAPVATFLHAPDAWVAGQQLVGTDPTRIAGKHEQRKRLRVLNPAGSAAVVYIAHSQNSATVTTAYPLAAGAPPLEFNHTDDVYAVLAPGATPQYVAVIAEFDTGRA
jgi:hypothetical protein